MSHRSSTSTVIAALSVALSVSCVATAAWAQPPPAGAPDPKAPAAAPPPDGAPPAAWIEEAPPVEAAPPAASPGGAEPSEVPPLAGTPAEAEPAAEPIALGGPGPRDVVDAVEPDRPLTKYRQIRLGFELGVRNVVVTDPSYDPYSEDDVLTQAALAATWMPLEVDALSLGLVGEWNPGGSTGSARGDVTSLFVHRVSVGAQARLALGRRVYLHAKVAPAAISVSGSIDDPAIARPLDAHGWTWGLDATGGAAVLIARAGDPDAPAFRVWIVGELGYAFAGAVEMSHTPDEDDDDPRRYGTVALAALDTSGIVNRFSVALTF